MTLGTKMITSVLACGLVPLAAVSYFSLTTAKRGMGEVSDKGNVSLEKQAYNQLLSVRDVKKRQIETYFAERKGDMGVLVENVATLRQQAFNNLIALREVKKKQIENYFSERKGDMGVLVETVNTLRAEAFNKLQAIQEQKKSQIDDYFSSLRAQLDILKGDPYAQQALSEFSQAFEAGGDSVDSPEWKAVAEKYQARMKNIMDDNGWYDLFLIDAAGDIVYTVTRESDLGMVIPDSELKDSSLGKAFAKAQKLGAGEIAVGDFASYAPSNGAPAGFMMGKMVNDAGELVGYCALQIPTDKINKIMLRRHGMGKTGESYLVGQDKLMRSDSFLDPAGHSVAASFKNNTTSDTEAIRSALAGGENQAVIMDYNGNPVLSCWNPVEIGSGVRWAMMSEIDVAEAFSPKIEGAEKDFFTRYKEQYGYYDLFLLNPDGYCFYTVAKEADYQTNLVNGKYADSNLGEVVQKVLQTRAFGFADFKPYEPSNGEPCAFIAQPVVHEGKVELIVALQLPLDAVNNIMGVRAGMGETGETYLIGPDKLMRSDSFLDPTNHTVAASFKNPSKGSVNTDAARQALAGKTDANVIMDYNNNPVLSAYTPIDVFGTTWGLLAEIDVAEAFCPKDKNGVYFYKKYAEMYGYYDLFLINPDGYCFYTVAQEADYQTNLINGKYSSSNLGKVTRQVLANKSFGFADFEPYAPSNGEPAAFIAQPVVHEGKTEIIVALQLPLDAINGIMGVRAGMGETGETYLIGPDKLMRSDSFLDPTNHTVAASFKNPTAGSVDTDAARAALSGGTDAKLVTDYNGNPVLSAYAPIDVFGTRWALLAEIDESEALAAVVAMKETSDLAVANLLKWGAGTAAVASVLLVMVGVLMARSITKPINRAIVGLTDGADQVTGAAGQVSSASQQLAEGASEQASSLEETSSSLEQMAAMTRTNASSAKEASQLATQARKNADEGEQIMGQLGSAMSAINQSSGEIGKIIKVIEEIAFQTNLLALNAAVEAARAGEHGKGFAVVAEEVRNLAQRSAKSARDTNDRIGESIERAKEGVEVSGKASKSLQSIVTDVSKVAELLNGISQASNEQAQGVEQVNTAVSQMDKVTQQNAAGAEESASAAEQLSAQARTVKGMVDELRAVIGGGGSEPVTPRALQTRKKPLRKKAGSDKGATGRALPRDFSAAAKDATGKSADKDMTVKEYEETLGEF